MLATAKGSEKRTLLGGVLVLVPAALFAKVTGLFYKIPLLHIVGVEGMAYFLAAYHVYSLLFVLSATGLPSALSLQIARAVAREREREVTRIFRVSLCFFLSLGIFGTLLLAFGAPYFADKMAMGEASYAIIAISPALLLASFIGAAKGYFQGHHKMGTTAICEVVEAAGKLGFGLLFAILAKKEGLPLSRVAAFAIFGITAGMLLAALFMAVALILAWRKAPKEKKKETASLPRRLTVLGELLRVALPVTLAASVMSVVSLVDTALISRRLQGLGYAPEVANAMYSSYGNLAVPLYNLIPSLLSPITLSLMPLLGAAHAKGEGETARNVFSAALRLCALVAIPAALGLALFAEPLLLLIFKGQEAAVSVAAPLLSLLAVSLLPLALLSLAGAALQATGHTLLPVGAMATGAAVKLLASGLFLSIPAVNIAGAPVSTLFCNFTVLVMEWVGLSRVIPMGFLPVKNLMRPLLAALPSLFVGAVLYVLCLPFGAGTLWIMPLVLLVTAVLYFFLVLLFRAVEWEDIYDLPFGDKICRILLKYKLLKNKEGKNNGYEQEKRGHFAKEGV